MLECTERVLHIRQFEGGGYVCVCVAEGMTVF